MWTGLALHPSEHVQFDTWRAAVQQHKTKHGDWPARATMWLADERPDWLTDWEATRGGFSEVDVAEVLATAQWSGIRAWLEKAEYPRVVSADLDALLRKRVFSQARASSPAASVRAHFLAVALVLDKTEHPDRKAWLGQLKERWEQAVTSVGPLDLRGFATQLHIQVEARVLAEPPEAVWLRSAMDLSLTDTLLSWEAAGSAEDRQFYWDAWRNLSMTSLTKGDMWKFTRQDAGWEYGVPEADNRFRGHLLATTVAERVQWGLAWAKAWANHPGIRRGSTEGLDQGFRAEWLRAWNLTSDLGLLTPEYKEAMLKVARSRKCADLNLLVMGGSDKQWAEAAEWQSRLGTSWRVTLREQWSRMSEDCRRKVLVQWWLPNEPSALATFPPDDRKLSLDPSFKAIARNVAVEAYLAGNNRTAPSWTLVYEQLVRHQGNRNERARVTRTYGKNARLMFDFFGEGALAALEAMHTMHSLVGMPAGEKRNFLYGALDPNKLEFAEVAPEEIAESGLGYIL